MPRVVCAWVLVVPCVPGCLSAGELPLPLSVNTPGGAFEAARSTLALAAAARRAPVPILSPEPTAARLYVNRAGMASALRED